MHTLILIGATLAIISFLLIFADMVRQLKRIANVFEDRLMEEKNDRSYMGDRLKLNIAYQLDKIAEALNNRNITSHKDL